MSIICQRATKDVSLSDEIRVAGEDPGAECQIRLSGRITIDSSPGLRALLLQRLESAACQTLTVDLAEVEYLDTSGLAILVEILRSARTLAKTFQLTGLRERPRYLLESTRLLHLFTEGSS